MAEIRNLENHECRQGNKGYFTFDHEIRDGLCSTLVFLCEACGEKRAICTNGDTKDKNLNVQSAWGAVMTGKGHSPITEMFGFMDIPYMSINTYRRYEKIVGQVSIFFIKGTSRTAIHERSVQQDTASI